MGGRNINTRYLQSPITDRYLMIQELFLVFYHCGLGYNQSIIDGEYVRSNTAFMMHCLQLLRVTLVLDKYYPYIVGEESTNHCFMTLLKYLPGVNGVIYFQKVEYGNGKN